MRIIFATLIILWGCSPKQATKDPASNDSQRTALDSVMGDTMSTLTSRDSMRGGLVDSANQENWDPGTVTYTGEQAIVYKTKSDYSNYVPVRMNAEKTKITAYPSPKDLFYKDKLAYPQQLQNGYWLDNRGVTVNSVFLSMTYEEYSKLDQAPLLSDLEKKILDKDPFREMYSLGTRARYKDEIAEINQIIERGALKKFKRIK